MDKAKLILFSAPAGVGKDVCIEYLHNKGYNFIRAECKELLHEVTMDLFNINSELYWEIYNNRETKEEPSELFALSPNEFLKLAKYLDLVITKERLCYKGYKISIREAVIYTSEIIFKPTYGQDYFGVARADKLVDGKVYVEGSYGFYSELEPTIDKLGKENILAIRIHRDGYDFSGDSRSYIEDNVVDNIIDIYNNTTLQGMFDKVEHEINKFLKG